MGEFVRVVDYDGLRGRIGGRVFSVKRLGIGEAYLVRPESSGNAEIWAIEGEDFMRKVADARLVDDPDVLYGLRVKIALDSVEGSG